MAGSFVARIRNVRRRAEHHFSVRLATIPVTGKGGGRMLKCAVEEPADSSDCNDRYGVGNGLRERHSKVRSLLYEYSSAMSATQTHMPVNMDDMHAMTLLGLFK